MISVIAGLISGAGSLFENYQKNKAKVQKRKDDIDDAIVTQELETIKSGNSRASDLDRIYAKGSKVMQRISFGFAMIPIFICFLPGGPPYVIRAFEALALLPDWYLYGLGGMMVSIWGFRGMLLSFLRVKCAFKKGIN